MVAFAFSLELDDELFGIGLVGIVEGGDGSPSQVADSPNYPHPSLGSRFGPPLARLGSRLSLRRRVPTKGFRRFGRGTQFMTIQHSSRHR